MKHLAGSKTLVDLDLSATAVADPAMSDLTALTKLEALNLHDTKVTDVGAKRLVGLKKLRTLNLGQEVTEAALKVLRSALPNCSISQNPR